MLQQKFQKRFGGEIKNGWLIVKDDLRCSYNQLTSLPENLEVKGNLYCSKNQLTSLPENLKVGSDLYCSYNQLTSLPENLEVKGSLCCFNNQLTSLPENLKVGGNLYCSDNPLKIIPKSVEKIKNVFIFSNVNWNDTRWINKILQDKLTAEEVFAIDNIEHRRVAYEYMDKRKMKELKDFKVLDEQIDDKDNPMKIVEFIVQNTTEPLKFLNCFCPSSKREYYIQTEKETCWEAKKVSFGLKDEVEWVEEW